MDQKRHMLFVSAILLGHADGTPLVVDGSGLQRQLGPEWQKKRKGNRRGPISVQWQPQKACECP
jgi:hypothetical protein